MAAARTVSDYHPPKGVVAPGSDDYDFTPKTRTVPASTIRKGDVILESDDHPARVIEVGGRPTRRYFRCRYLWQTPDEAAWSCGPFSATHPIAKKVR